jgi:transposase
MHAIVHGADVQDRDGGVLLMATLFGLHPFLLKLYADGGYQGAQFQDALGAILKRVNIEIVKRSDQAQRFVVLPKRWIVERTFAWLGRCRRLAKDWECLNRKALAFLKLASIRLMTRKLAIQNDVPGQTLTQFLHRWTTAILRLPTHNPAPHRVRPLSGSYRPSVGPSLKGR